MYLNKGWCACGSWQINGVLNKYVKSCISYLKKDPLGYVNKCLTKEVYLKIYEGMINHVLDEVMWTKVDVDKIAAPNY